MWTARVWEIVVICSRKGFGWGRGGARQLTLLVVSVNADNN